MLVSIYRKYTYTKDPENEVAEYQAKEVPSGMLVSPKPLETLTL